MILKVFSIYDVKAEAFGAPFAFQAVGLGIRFFTDLVNDGRSTPSRFPSDFQLFQVGSFDDASASLVSEKPVALGLGISFVSKEVGIAEKVMVSPNGDQ